MCLRLDAEPRSENPYDGTRIDCPAEEDVGELAILAEIDFVDGKNSMLACSVWGTDETEFSLVEEMEE